MLRVGESRGQSRQGRTGGTYGYIHPRPCSGLLDARYAKKKQIFNDLLRGPMACANCLGTVDIFAHPPHHEKVAPARGGINLIDKFIQYNMLYKFY